MHDCSETTFLNCPAHLAFRLLVCCDASWAQHARMNGRATSGPCSELSKYFGALNNLNPLPPPLADGCSNGLLSISRQSSHDSGLAGLAGSLGGRATEMLSFLMAECIGHSLGHINIGPNSTALAATCHSEFTT